MNISVDIPFELNRNEAMGPTSKHSYSLSQLRSQGVHISSRVAPPVILRPIAVRSACASHVGGGVPVSEISAVTAAVVDEHRPPGGRVVLDKASIVEDAVTVDVPAEIRLALRAGESDTHRSKADVESILVAMES